MGFITTKMKEIPFIILQTMQKEIIEYIPRMFVIIDNAIERIEKEINLITEYRTSLISDLVTGKVDVRSIIVEDLSDVIEENEELEEIEALDEPAEEMEV